MYASLYAITHLATAILAITTAAASWSKLADTWFRLEAASAQLEEGEKVYKLPWIHKHR